MLHQFESVAQDFAAERLHRARDLAWEVLSSLASTVRAGDTRATIGERLKRITDAAGIEKHWHPPQIRLGQNTLCYCGETPRDDAPLKTNDIFFLDLGMIVDGYEADVGRTFTVGNDVQMHAIAEAAQRIHQEGAALWAATRCSGKALYEWTHARAAELGYVLSTKEADGHRIGDFPHHRYSKAALIDVDFSVAPDRWVYEVHLLKEVYGAFSEDVLTAQY